MGSFHGRRVVWGFVLAACMTSVAAMVQQPAQQTTANAAKALANAGGEHPPSVEKIKAAVASSEAAKSATACGTKGLPACAVGTAIAAQSPNSGPSEEKIRAVINAVKAGAAPTKGDAADEKIRAVIAQVKAEEDAKNDPDKAKAEADAKAKADAKALREKQDKEANEKAKMESKARQAAAEAYQSSLSKSKAQQAALKANVATDAPTAPVAEGSKKKLTAETYEAWCPEHDSNDCTAAWTISSDCTLRRCHLRETESGGDGKCGTKWHDKFMDHTLIPVCDCPGAQVVQDAYNKLKANAAHANKAQCAGPDKIRCGAPSKVGMEYKSYTVGEPKGAAVQPAVQTLSCNSDDGSCLTASLKPWNMTTTTTTTTRSPCVKDCNSTAATATTTTAAASAASA